MDENLREPAANDGLIPSNASASLRIDAQFLEVFGS